jgi:hypothetical protein
MEPPVLHFGIDTAPLRRRKERESLLASIHYARGVFEKQSISRLCRKPFEAGQKANAATGAACKKSEDSQAQKPALQAGFTTSGGVCET